MRKIASLFLLCAGTLSGQHVPVVGWIATDGVIRPLVGLPGSTQAGEPAASFADVLIAPGGKLARVIDQEESALMLLGPMTRLRQWSSRPTSSVFSPDGSAFALALGQQVEVYAGLPDGLTRVWNGEAPDGSSVLAVSNNGKCLVLANEDDLLVQVGTERHRLPLPRAAIRSLKFGSGDTLLVGDRTTGSLLRFSFREGPVSNLVATIDPEDMAESVDGARLFLLVRDGDSTVVRILAADTGQVVNELLAGREASALIRMGRGDSFMLAAPGAEKLGWAFHADGVAPAITFIPATGGAQ